MYYENSCGWIYINNKTVTAVTIDEVIYFKSTRTIDLNQYYYGFIDMLEVKESFKQSRLNKFLDDEQI